MQAYMEDYEHGEAIVQYYDVALLSDNPTINHIKAYKKVARKAKARVCQYAAVSPTIFNRIMAMKSVK